MYTVYVMLINYVLDTCKTNVWCVDTFPPNIMLLDFLKAADNNTYSVLVSCVLSETVMILFIKGWCHWRMKELFSLFTSLSLAYS